MKDFNEIIEAGKGSFKSFYEENIIKNEEKRRQKKILDDLRKKQRESVKNAEPTDLNKGSNVTSEDAMNDLLNSVTSMARPDYDRFKRAVKTPIEQDMRKQLSELEEVLNKRNAANAFKEEEDKKTPSNDVSTEPETSVTEEVEETIETIEEVLAELDQLIGMDEIKDNIQSLLNLLKNQDERRKHDLPIVDIGLHTSMHGAPGTGKTTIARIIGRAYKAAGRLSKGHLIETDRQGLVGGFVGQTAIKTQELLETARGGVLFIDEAYSLVPETTGSDFGIEAITTILKFMEDNRDDFVLIVAGYPDEMERFLDSNPGLVSRFNDVINFPDYSGEELFKMFKLTSDKNHYTFNKPVEEKISKDFDWMVENKGKNFANGRSARKYFETIVENQANRLSSKKNLTARQLKNVTMSDLPKDLSKFV